jgi:chemotaxis protein CheX
MTCVLTIPSIMRGSDFTIEPTTTTRRRISTFQCDDSRVVVEVLLKPNSAQTALAA